MKSNECSTLNSLLRGELAATETYQQALAKVGNEAGVADLRRIHAEHREAANTLRQHIHVHGGKPDPHLFEIIRLRRVAGGFGRHEHNNIHPDKHHRHRSGE